MSHVPFEHPSVGAGPRVLLFAIQTSHTGSCRLPRFLKEAGFTVGVLGLRRSLLHASSHVDSRMILRARRFEPLIRSGLEKAFHAFRPDIIVPCDERAVSVVNHWMARPGRILSAGLENCLAYSLGDVDTLQQRFSKIETLILARSIGIGCPRDIRVAGLAECEAAATELGYPVLLKLSHGAGGNGVVLCRSLEDLRRAWRGYMRLRSPIKSIRRKLLRRDWFGESQQIFVQEFIPGIGAMTCASCLAGRTMSVVSGLIDKTVNDTGPASVVTLVNHPGVVEATEKMVGRMGISGFSSFDFIVRDDGEVRLLECNPRPTQMLHLGPLVGVNPAIALLDALKGGLGRQAIEVPVGERKVAFFPQEFRRDPGSPNLFSIYHDVPWNEPRLLAAMLAKRPVTWRLRHIP